MLERDVSSWLTPSLRLLLVVWRTTCASRPDTDPDRGAGGAGADWVRYIGCTAFGA
jgi:hypothetical protein